MDEELSAAITPFSEGHFSFLGLPHLPAAFPVGEGAVLAVCLF